MHAAADTRRGQIERPLLWRSWECKLQGTVEQTATGVPIGLIDLARADVAGAQRLHGVFGLRGCRQRDAAQTDNPISSGKKGGAFTSLEML